MPELRQFASIVQLNENIELSKMQMDDMDANVSTNCLFRASSVTLVTLYCVLFFVRT